MALAKASEDTALIAHQRLRIAKLERQVYGFPKVLGTEPFGDRGHPSYDRTPRVAGTTQNRSIGSTYLATSHTLGQSTLCLTSRILQAPERLA